MVDLVLVINQIMEEGRTVAVEQIAVVELIVGAELIVVEEEAKEKSLIKVEDSTNDVLYTAQINI